MEIICQEIAVPIDLSGVQRFLPLSRTLVFFIFLCCFSEFKRLVDTALERKDYRMVQLIQILGGTELRISELGNLTVEAVQDGFAHICCCYNTVVLYTAIS